MMYDAEEPLLIQIHELRADVEMLKASLVMTNGNERALSAYLKLESERNELRAEVEKLTTALAEAYNSRALDAAIEIERLRLRAEDATTDAVRNHKLAMDRWEEIESLRAEVERLTAEIRKIQKAHMVTCDMVVHAGDEVERVTELYGESLAAINRVQDKNERLRAALREIADWSPHYPKNRTREELVDIASRALWDAS